MICDEVKRAAYDFLDGAIDNTRQYLVKHLDECAECGNRVMIHRRIRNFIKSRLKISAAPTGLVGKIRESLHSAKDSGMA